MMNTYFATQDSRPTPYATDGLRRYSGKDNPQYIIAHTKPQKENTAVKVQLTSDIKKVFDQTKEEMATVKKRKKPQPKKSTKKRKITKTTRPLKKADKKKTNKGKTSHCKKTSKSKHRKSK